MKIAFVGGGPSNIFASLYLKRAKPDFDIVIFDSNKEAGKKLRMTGNGKCNIAPIKDNPNLYNNINFVNRLFNDIPLDKYLDILSSFGIITKTINNFGYYPLSESAPNVVDILNRKIKELGIKFVNKKVVEYEDKNSGVSLYFDDGKVDNFDHVFFAVGGMTYPKTGSDGNMFKILEKHGYNLTKLNVSLCPLKVKEKVKNLFGARAKAVATLYVNNVEASKEEGEVMFKKDGLSGISAMNLSRLVDLSKHNIIKLDLLNGNNEILFNRIEAYQYLLSYVSEPIALYVLEKSSISRDEVIGKEKQKSLLNMLKNLSFEVVDFYDLENAQMTRGGINLSDLDECFRSKKEKNVSFFGEMIDIDGPCGGYNLRFAITSGIKAVNIYME